MTRVTAALSVPIRYNKMFVPRCTFTRQAESRVSALCVLRRCNLLQVCRTHSAQKLIELSRICFCRPGDDLLWRYRDDTMKVVNLSSPVLDHRALHSAQDCEANLLPECISLLARLLVLTICYAYIVNTQREMCLQWLKLFLSIPLLLLLLTLTFLCGHTANTRPCDSLNIGVTLIMAALYLCKLSLKILLHLCFFCCMSQNVCRE